MRERAGRAERKPQGGSRGTPRLVWKQHQIYTTQLPSGYWVAAVVDFRTRKSLTVESLTNEVIPLPGQFFSEAWATQAAQDYIDRQASQLPRERYPVGRE